jgi:hypothetical protein
MHGADRNLCGGRRFNAGLDLTAHLQHPSIAILDQTHELPAAQDHQEHRLSVLVLPP